LLSSFFFFPSLPGLLGNRAVFGGRDELELGLGKPTAQEPR
jgi:hypothetical protein